MRRSLEARGLFERQRLYYALETGGVLASYLAGLAALPLLEGTAWVYLDAAFMAVVFVRVAFLGHDAAHHQIAASKRWNEAWGLLHLNLLLGASLGWWADKHNRHHAHPNHLERDPDVRIPLLAFSEEQARAKRGFARQVVRFQAFLFLPMLLLEGLHLRVRSLETVVAGGTRYPRLEPLLTVLHYVLFFGFVLFALGPGSGAIFLAVQHALIGLYLGLVFTPNHAGMPLVADTDPSAGWVRQVSASRNLRGGRAVQFVFGGLNYQVEHHLWPGMARNKLAEASPSVREFCRAHGVEYVEVGALRAVAHVLGHLHRVGAPLRREPADG